MRWKAADLNRAAALGPPHSIQGCTGGQPLPSEPRELLPRPDFLGEGWPRRQDAAVALHFLLGPFHQGSVGSSCLEVPAAVSVQSSPEAVIDLGIDVVDDLFEFIENEIAGKV